MNLTYSIWKIYLPTQFRLPERLPWLTTLNGWRALAAIFLVGFAVMVYFWHQEYARAAILQQFIERAVIMKGTP